ncbi:hypothetical protein Tsubulata_023347 [Turnera subulata]|uniref:STAS domain-containing protein n=1 Tax=Turnera subulata TaxID=218843 RepID=A0A9Q0JBQ1_9ROSI|nr:hypothetical protein Tsubulata_023347 [Turnera subulata]
MSSSSNPPPPPPQESSSNNPDGGGHHRINIVTTPPTQSSPRSSSGSPPPVVHHVCLPPHVTTFEKLKHKFGEIFFPEDPFHVYKDQTLSNKIVLGIKQLFPILAWAPSYNLELFKSDFIAGITIASLAIPQGISYAKLASLPPTVGLYSSFVPPLIYTVFGSSRHIGIGPVAVGSLVMGSMLTEEISPTDQKDLYLQIAFTATLFAGLFEAALGLLRLGFIIDFLSKATLIGFMTGVATVVALQQLKGLFGITHFTSKFQAIPVIESVVSNKDEWSVRTMIMGFCFLAFLLTAKQISAKRPKLFWVTAAAPLTSIIVSTLIMYLFQFHDVSIIGRLPRGINPSSLDKLYLHGPYLSLAIKTGITVAVLSLAVGGFARSAVNYNAGAKTAVSNFVMAMAVLVTLLFLIPLFTYTPNFILSAIIVTAVIGLIDFEGAYNLWRVDKLDCLSCFCSFLGVVFVSVQLGLTIAVSVSVFRLILNVARPNTTILGNIPGTDIYQSLALYKNALRVPSFLILRIESPIMFSNSIYLQERILRWIRDEEQWIKTNGGSSLRSIILDLGAVTNIDTTGVDALRDLRHRLDGRSLQLVLVNPLALVVEKLDETGLLESFKHNGLYLTVGEAVIDISSSWKP